MKKGNSEVGVRLGFVAVLTRPISWFARNSVDGRARLPHSKVDYLLLATHREQEQPQGFTVIVGSFGIDQIGFGLSAQPFKLFKFGHGAAYRTAAFSVC